MTHLGQRLSALIDGELEGSERERVLVHMAKCGSCRDEVAALRTLKRRMNALGEAAAGAGLTGRLIGLSALADIDSADQSEAGPAGTGWPERAGGLPPAGTGWPQHSASSLPADPPDRGHRAEQRTGRYFLAGSLVIFLAGLGTAAVIAGGEPQPQAPTPPVTPSVDVLVFPHGAGNGAGTGGASLAGPSTVRPRPPRIVPNSVHMGG